MGADSMDKLHGTADFAQYAAYSWNIFRYLGDYLHLAGIIALLGTLLKNQSAAGFSLKSVVLYLVIFVCRYLDLFHHSQTAYLVLFKLFYIGAMIAACAMFHMWGKTVEHRKDTCNVVIIFIPCFVAALLLTEQYSIMEILWTYSEFLEGFAMVPQYIFCYRDPGNKDQGVFAFVMFTGAYRVLYALNWIYKKWQMPKYHDMQSWMGGLIEIGFFVDYCCFKIRGSSFLKSTVLKVDEKINEMQDKVELTIGISRAINRESEGGEMRKRRGVEEPPAMV